MFDGRPRLSSSSIVMTSTGRAASSGVPSINDPVTMTSSRRFCFSCATACAAQSVSEIAVASDSSPFLPQRFLLIGFPLVMRRRDAGSFAWIDHGHVDQERVDQGHACATGVAAVSLATDGLAAFDDDWTYRSHRFPHHSARFLGPGTLFVYGAVLGDRAGDLSTATRSVIFAATVRDLTSVDTLNEWQCTTIRHQHRCASAVLQKIHSVWRHQRPAPLEHGGIGRADAEDELIRGAREAGGLEDRRGDGALIDD